MNKMSNKISEVEAAVRHDAASVRTRHFEDETAVPRGKRAHNGRCLRCSKQIYERLRIFGVGIEEPQLDGQGNTDPEGVPFAAEQHCSYAHLLQKSGQFGGA